MKTILPKIYLILVVLSIVFGSYLSALVAVARQNVKDVRYIDDRCLQHASFIYASIEQVLFVQQATMKKMREEIDQDRAKNSMWIKSNN